MLLSAKMELAANAGNFELLKIIYEKNCNLRNSFDFGKSLFLAAKKGHYEIVKFLVEHKSNGIDDAILIACEKGHFQIVQFLFHRKLSLSNFILCLFTACDNNHMEIVKFFISKYWVSYCYLFLCAIQKNNLRLVKFFVKEDLVNIRMFNDMPICYACEHGALQIVKFFVENGANVNAQNYNDNGLILYTAIEFACLNKHYNIANFLIEHGADTTPLSAKDVQIISFCKKMENNRKIRAANKIYFWWIPFCYNVNLECGKRMMERSWQRVSEMYEKRN